jgi:hypothetical protein
LPRGDPFGALPRCGSMASKTLSSRGVVAA